MFRALCGTCSLPRENGCLGVQISSENGFTFPLINEFEILNFKIITEQCGSCDKWANTEVLHILWILFRHYDLHKVNLNLPCQASHLTVVFVCFCSFLTWTPAQQYLPGIADACCLCLALAFLQIFSRILTASFHGRHNLHPFGLPKCLSSTCQLTELLLFSQILRLLLCITSLLLYF